MIHRTRQVVRLSNIVEPDLEGVATCVLDRAPHITRM